MGTFLGTFGVIDDASAQWLVSADLVVAIPVDEFADVSDTGTGLNLRGQYRFRSVPSLSLRTDAVFITYQYGLYSAGFYAVETRTQSMRFTVGPQFSFRYRRSEFYLSPMYGLFNFNTHEDIPGTIYSKTRSSNTEFGWSVSSGVQIGIHRMPKRSYDLALDIGGSWHSVPEGVKSEFLIDDEEVTVLSDVTEFCIHAGITLRFR